MQVENLASCFRYDPIPESIGSIDRESKVIFDNFVTLEQGTGIVHTAPGHGVEDYIVGLQYGLDVYCPVDDYGKFTDEFPQMQGTFVFDANEMIVDLLKKAKVLSITVLNGFNV